MEIKEFRNMRGAFYNFKLYSDNTIASLVETYDKKSESEKKDLLQKGLDFFRRYYLNYNRDFNSSDALNRDGNGITVIRKTQGLWMIAIACTAMDKHNIYLVPGLNDIYHIPDIGTGLHVSHSGLQEEFDYLLELINRKIVDKQYYSVVLGRYVNGKPVSDCSICIAGIRKPEKEEAEKFYKDYIKKLGYEFVSGVSLLPCQEVWESVDIKFPVFDDKTKEREYVIARNPSNSKRSLLFWGHKTGNGEQRSFGGYTDNLDGCEWYTLDEIESKNYHFPVYDDTMSNEEAEKYLAESNLIIKPEDLEKLGYMQKVVMCKD